MYNSAAFTNLKAKGPRKSSFGIKRSGVKRAHKPREQGPEIPCFVPESVAFAIEEYHRMYFSDQDDPQLVRVIRRVDGQNKTMFLYAHKFVKMLLSYVVSQEGYFSTLEVEDLDTEVRDSGGRREVKTTKFKLFQLPDSQQVELSGEKGKLLHQLAKALETLLITSRNSRIEDPASRIRWFNSTAGKYAPTVKELTRKNILNNILPTAAAMSNEMAAWTQYCVEEKTRLDYLKNLTSQGVSSKALNAMSDQEKLMHSERAILAINSMEDIQKDSNRIAARNSLGIRMDDAINSLRSIKPQKSTTSSQTSTAKQELKELLDSYNELLAQDVKEKELTTARYSIIKQDVAFMKNAIDRARNMGLDHPRFTLNNTGRAVEMKADNGMHNPQMPYNPYNPYGMPQYPQLGYGMPQYPQLPYGMPQYPQLGYGMPQYPPQQPNFVNSLLSQLTQSQHPSGNDYPQNPPTAYEPNKPVAKVAPANLKPLSGPAPVLTAAPRVAVTPKQVEAGKVFTGRLAAATASVSSSSSSSFDGGVVKRPVGAPVSSAVSRLSQAMQDKEKDLKKEKQAAEEAEVEKERVEPKVIVSVSDEIKEEAQKIAEEQKPAVVVQDPDQSAPLDDLVAEPENSDDEESDEESTLDQDQQ